MSTKIETPLYTRLISLIRELNLFPGMEVTADTSLLRSGVIDSSAVLELAVWIQSEVGEHVDLLAIRFNQRVGHTGQY